MKSAFLAVLLLPLTLHGQGSTQDSIWLPFRTFLGTWKGTGGGQPGIGTYERTYRFVLEKKFIEAR